MFNIVLKMLSVKRRAGLLLCFAIKRVAFSFLIIFSTALFLPISTVHALTDHTVFEPQRFDRLKGKPTVYSESIQLNDECLPAKTAILRVWSGDGKDTRMTAAEVYINGVEYVHEHEFKKQTPYIEKIVPIKAVNTLWMRLKSGNRESPSPQEPPTSFLKIEVVAQGCDFIPPEVYGPVPVEGAYVDTGTPEISAAYKDDAEGSGVDLSAVRILLDGSDVTPGASVAGSKVSFKPSVKIPEGNHTVNVAVADFGKNEASLSWNFVSDTIAPVVTVTSHVNDVYLNTPTIAVSGTLEEANPYSVKVNGLDAVIGNGTFSVAALNLTEGANTITVTAVDKAGNVGTTSININLDTVAPVVAVTSQSDGVYLNTPNVSVSGTLNELNPASVKVNGYAAVISDGGFTLAALNLSEGANTITVTAVDKAGNIGTTSININLDTVAPVVGITSHVNDVYLNTPTIAVSGSMNEINPQSVAVNGFATEFTEGSFNLAALSLAEGANAISVTATDKAGNVGTTSITINLDTVVPVVGITSHEDNVYLNTPTISVSGSLDELNSASVKVNGLDAVITNGGLSLSALTLAEGANTISVTATDKAGNVGATSITINLDTVAPVVGITSHVDGVYLNTPTITIAGSLDELNPVSVKVNGFDAVIGDGTFNLAALSLTEGSNTISVTATDKSGNVGTTSINVNLDTVAPVVGITSHVDGVYLNTPTISLAGSLDELNPASVKVNGLDAEISNGAFSLAALNLTEGVNTISVTAIDNAGNVGTASIVINLDTVAPIVEVTSQIHGVYLNTPTVAVRGSLDELNPVSVKVNGHDAVISAGGFSLSDLSLAEGANTITVTATDKAGNTGTRSITINLDTVAPVVSVTSHEDNVYLNTPTISVGGTLDEINPASVKVNGLDAVIGDGTFSLAALSLAEGANTISLMVTDKAGNVGTTSITINLDTVAPVVGITSHENNVYLNTPAIAVNGSLNELNPQSIKVNGLSAEFIAGAGGSFNIGALSLSEGANTISVTVTDKAGNVGTTSIIVNLDTAAPVVEITSHINDIYLKTPTIAVSGSMNEINPQLVTVNGFATEFTEGTEGSFNLSALSLSEGANTVTVTAVDRAGNTGSASIIINLDTVAPVVGIASHVDGVYLNTPTVSVSGTLDELNPASVKVNGLDAVIGNGLFNLSAFSLSEGANTVTVTATDKAGNVGAASININLDTVAPVVGITSHVNDVYLNTPTIAVSGSMNEINPQSVMVNGFATEFTEGSFNLSALSLSEGANTVTVTAVDRAGNTGSASIIINLDTVAPVVGIASHVDGVYLNTPTVSVSGTLVELNPVSVKVNGLDAGITDGGFSLAVLSLAEGANIVTVTATDKAGNVGTISININLDTVAPVVGITSQVDGVYLNTPTISVGGTLDEINPASVKVNGLDAVIGDGTFTLAALSLTEGANTIFVTATDKAGNVGTTTITINLDTVAPVVAVTSHEDNVYLNTPMVSVSGSLVELNPASVRVNGLDAMIGDGTFSVAALDLSEGANTITVEAIDKAGNVGTISIVINLDTVAPVVAVTSHEDNVYLNTPAIAVSGSMDELNPASVKVNGHDAVISGGGFSLPDLSLTEGANIISVTATDKAGNTGTTSITINLDTVVPVLGITSHENNVYLNTPTIAVNGSLVELNPASVKVNGLDAEIGDGTFSVSGLSLMEGANTVTVTATDKAGNTGTTSITINLDTVAPVVAVTSHVDDVYLNTPTISVSGSLDELNPDSVKVNGHDAEITGGGFSLNSLSLSEGANTVTVTATDKAGNAGTTSITINLDTVAPVVSVTSHVNDVYLNTPSISISGTMDESNPASVTVNGHDAEVTGGGFSLNSLSLTEGANTISVTATDKAGNTGTTSITINLDTVAPVVAVTSHEDNVYLNTPTIAVSGSLDELNPISVKVNGVDAEMTDGSCSLAELLLTEGANTVTVTVTDKAGNVGTTSIVINLDTVAPTVAVTSHENNAYLNTPTISVSGSLAELNPASVKVNGLDAVIAEGGFSLDGLTLTEGVNTIAVTATDKAGNMGTVSIVINLDTVAPVVTIDAPIDGALLKYADISIAGHLNEPVISVVAGGLPAGITGLDFSRSGYPLAEGLNHIIVTATDRAGNTGSASVSVTADTTAPQPPILYTLATPTNSPVISVPGSAEGGTLITLTGIYPGGTTASVGTVTSEPSGSFVFSGISLAEGMNSFRAIASDSAGNISGDSTTVSVVFDSSPPVIEITSPENNHYAFDPNLTISGTVNETATVTINGSAAVMNGNAFEGTVTLEKGVTIITISAVDEAGNTSSEEITVNLVLESPEVTIISPKEGLLTKEPSVRVEGSIVNPVVSVMVNGNPALLTGQDFVLENLSITEGQNQITVEAKNEAGISGSATVTVIRDASAPLVSIGAPSSGDAGANITLTVSASDSSGVALIEVRSGGLLLWSDATESLPVVTKSFSYKLPSGLESGALYELEVTALDAAGNSASGQATVAIAAGASGPGYIQGEVYNDVRGLRLGGASATITGMDSLSVKELALGNDGTYFTEIAAGTYLVRLNGNGYTGVERIVTVKPELKSEALDGRLTPVNDVQNLVGPEGATLIAGPQVQISEEETMSRVEVVIPDSALEEVVDLRLTPLSNQGLAGLLPRGWSPLATVDIREEGQTFGEKTDFAVSIGITVALSGGSAFSANDEITLVRYDDENHRWIVLEPGLVSEDASRITAMVISTGQYAFVLPDPCNTELETCPEALAALPLPSFDVSYTPEVSDLSASGRVVPSASPPSKGLKAVGEVVVLPAEGSETPLSGLVLNGNVTERFDLNSGEAVLPSDFVEDILFYRYPSVTNDNPTSSLATEGSLFATFPVMPSRDYTIVELLMGKVGMEIKLPVKSDRGVLIGEEGGRFTDADGNMAVIPEGALSKTVPVETNTADAADFASLTGEEVTLLAAVEISFSGQVLSNSAELSAPPVVSVESSLPIIVARVFEADGRRRLKLSALGKLSGSLVTSHIAAPEGVALPGIREGGTYLFLQPSGAIGFVTGEVKAGWGASFETALVTVTSLPLADLAVPGGTYLLAASLSDFSVKAVDLSKRNEGSASGAISSPSEIATHDVTITPTAPRVVSITPADGETGVEAKAPIVITFSEPVLTTTVTAETISLEDASGNNLTGVISVDASGTEVTFYPSTLLASETLHKVSVSTAVTDLQGLSIGSGFSSGFTMRDTTPPPLPPAGSITSTFPDEEGYITVTATQGSAEPDSAVLIINEESGMIVGVSPNSDGSFTARIQAMLGDEIRVVFMDEAGNQTLISYITFKSDDGRHFVSAKGGIVEGPGGTQLVVPDGALPYPAVIKLTVVTEEELVEPVPAETGFLAAVKLDADGVRFNKEVELSFPVPENLPEGAQPFLVNAHKIINMDGVEEEIFEVVDTLKVIDGRLTTASPPFLGIVDPGYLIALFSYFPIDGPVIVSGYTYHDKDGLPGYLRTEAEDSDQPLSGTVIRMPNMSRIVTFSRADGFYATIGFSPNAMCRTFPMSAEHPRVQQGKLDFNIESCITPYVVNRFNIQMADKFTVFPDDKAPIIKLDLEVASEQDEEHENARFVAGMIPVGTNIKVPVIVIDEEITETPILTVYYEAPGMEKPDSYTAQLNLKSERLYKDEEDEKLFTKYEYTAIFSGAIEGSSPTYFMPDKSGTYIIEVDAVDSNDNRDKQQVKVRAFDLGDMPGPTDGCPLVDVVSPPDESEEIMVTMPIRVTFNEPVKDIDEDTLYLLDNITGGKVDAYVYTLVEGGRVVGVIQPKRNLSYNRTYTVKAIGASDQPEGAIGTVDPIMDSVENTELDPEGEKKYCAEPDEEGLLPLKETFTSTFKTKEPRIYDPDYSDADPADIKVNEFSGGKAVALYSWGGKTYAYVAAGFEGWHVIDVTDPTNPAKVYGFNPVHIDFRDVAIDEETGIMAITENIVFHSSGQYGMVRFYNIKDDPENPEKIGQTRLAEAWSGVPNNVAIYEGHAYISTIMQALYVVEIELSKDYTKEDAYGAIVGMYDPVDEGYGQPGDLSIYGSKAALTTSMGYVVILDLTMPYYPLYVGNVDRDVPMHRIAAAKDYSYVTENGTNKVMDIGVAGSNRGGIYTLDLTNPYGPVRIAPVLDDEDNELTAVFSGIVINKKGGLVLATSGGSVYIIDIKDPYNPLLLNKIEEAPVGEGSLVDEPLGYVKGLAEKDGWAYLGSMDAGFRVLDLDPVVLKYVCDKSVFFACDEYYPALGYVGNDEPGKKRILLEGRNWVNALLNDGTARAKLHYYTPMTGVRIKAVNDEKCPGSYVPCSTFNEKGLAEFHVTTDRMFPWDTEKITLEFEIDRTSIKGMNSLANDLVGKDKVKVELKVRTNAITDLQEVLDGKAVFTHEKYTKDSDNADLPKSEGEIEKHKSKTEGKEPKDQSLDFVQKMLNHILVPLRKDASDDTIKKTHQINTINVEGLYNDDTLRSIKAIINGIEEPEAEKVPYLNKDIFNEKIVNTTVEYHKNRDDGLKSTFERVAREYDLYDEETETIELDEGRIIDKELLLGIDEPDEDQVHVHKKPSDDDIGIYELYNCNDWDGDGISNYIEVENELNPLLEDPGYTDPDSHLFSVERGGRGNGLEKQGLLESGLRIPNINKGYYYFVSGDPIDDLDNYGALRALTIIENVGNAWENRYPDLYPLKKNMFVRDGAPTIDSYKTNIYTHPDLDHNDDDDDDNALEGEAPNETRIGIGDISLTGGGPFYRILDASGTLSTNITDHQTHQNGLGMDIRFIRDNNTEGTVDVRPNSLTLGLYSQELTMELINLLFDYGAFRVYVVAETGIAQSVDNPNRQIRYVPRHHDHLHADFPIVNLPVGNIDLRPVVVGPMPADGASTVPINVVGRDIYGFPLVAVTASTNNGRIVVGNNAVLRQNVSIDNFGNMSFQYRAGTEPGEATVTATSIPAASTGEEIFVLTPVAAE